MAGPAFLSDPSGSLPAVTNASRADRPTPGEPDVVLRRRWPPLTAALKDTRSPVRAFLDQRFPNTREIQRRYRDSAGPLRTDGRANPGTIGGAFDWTIRFLAHPCPDLQLALLGATHAPAIGRALWELARLLGFVIDDDGHATVGSRFTGPVAGSLVEPELLARGCWALALLTDLFRVGLTPTSPLAGVDLRASTADQLLSMAPNDGVAELIALRVDAERVLLPALATRRGSWALGPTFAGSRLMNADADLIAAGLLLELKTNLGNKRADGRRQASLDGQTILQLLGYVLLDLTDEFAVSEIGVYNARYAHLSTWSLADVLQELAGRAIDLAAERSAFKRLLLS